MVTEAVLRYGNWEKVIRICNIPVAAKMRKVEVLGMDSENLIYQFAGVNHFHWHKVADKDSNDIALTLIDKLFDNSKGIPKNIYEIPYFKEQLQQMKMIPCDYHRYYYRFEEISTHNLEEYRIIGTRAEQVKQIEHDLFELYKNPALNYKPKQLEERGGVYYSDTACKTIAAIYANKNTEMVVSTRNNGVILDLPSECTVEVTTYIGSQGARTVSFGSLPTAGYK